MDSVRTLDLLLDLSLLVLNRGHDRLGVGLEIGDRALQSADGLGVLRNRRLLGLGGLLGLLGSSLSRRSGLLGLLELGITVSELTLERIDLAALCVHIVTQLFDLRLHRRLRSRLVRRSLFLARAVSRGLRMASYHSRYQYETCQRLQFGVH